MVSVCCPRGESTGSERPCAVPEGPGPCPAVLWRAGAPSSPFSLPGHGGVSCCCGGGSRDREGTGGSPGSPVRDRAVSAPAGPWLRSPPGPSEPPGTGTPSPGPRRGDRPAPVPVRGGLHGVPAFGRGSGLIFALPQSRRFTAVPTFAARGFSCGTGRSLKDAVFTLESSFKGYRRSEKCWCVR